MTHGKLLEDIEYQTKEIDTKYEVKVKKESEDIQAVRTKLSELTEKRLKD